MEKRPSAEQLAKYKSNAKNESFSADVRAKFQSIVDKFENVGEAVVDAIEQKKERKPRTTKTTTKVVATKQTKSDIESAKAEIKKRTGKTEEECESIVEEYRTLRTKSQERKKKEVQSTADNKDRVDKLKKDDKIISGTNEKTADAVIETTTKDVAEKIVKELDKIEQKAEVEATKEVKKEMPKESTTEQNKAIAEKTEEKVKEIVKTKTKRILIDTSDLLTSIAESLGKFDKDSQKLFLIKLRSDIDKLLTKFSLGGSTMGATQGYNITQSNMSSSSVNPTLFDGGGGVGDFSEEVGKDLIQNYDMSASDVSNLLMDYYDEIKDMQRSGKNSSEVADHIAKLDGESYLEEEYGDDEYKRGGGVGRKNLDSIKNEYLENQDNNYHSENVVLLAKNFGTDNDYKEALRILSIHNKEGHLFGENSASRRKLSQKLIDKARKEMAIQGIEFKRGGGVGEKLMGGQPNSSKPSGYTLIKSKGREIIVTDDGGKTQERWIKSNGYSGYTLRYNGNQYEFTDSFAKGGMTEHGLKEGDTIIGENGYQKDEVYVLDRNKNTHYVNLDKGQRFNNGGGVGMKYKVIAKGNNHFNEIGTAINGIEKDKSGVSFVTLHFRNGVNTYSMNQVSPIMYNNGGGVVDGNIKINDNITIKGNKVMVNGTDGFVNSGTINEWFEDSPKVVKEVLNDKDENGEILYKRIAESDNFIYYTLDFEDFNNAKYKISDVLDYYAVHKASGRGGDWEIWNGLSFMPLQDEFKYGKLNYQHPSLKRLMKQDSYYKNKEKYDNGGGVDSMMRSRRGM